MAVHFDSEKSWLKELKMADPMTAPAIRWGILGPGGIAHRFAHEVGKYTKSTIVAVGSRDADRARSFADEFHIDRAYGSYEELVADPDLDAVYVSSPHSEHHDHALLALHAGKPVLVEKSFTLNVKQAEEVFAEALAHNLFAAEAMWSRYLPHYLKLKELQADGTLGEVTGIVAQHCQQLNLHPDWRMMRKELGGGALLDLGVYTTALFHHLLGKPESVHAVGVLTKTGVDLRETVSQRYGTGALCTALNDMGSQSASLATVIGTKARVEIPGPFYVPQDLILTKRNTAEHRDGETQVLPTKVDGGFQYEAAEAARCITEGLLESPLHTWRDTLEVLAVMDVVRAELGVRFDVD
jgi:predicted dehydrogenase